MAKVAPKDLFDEKTMTFGEHLEELRVCLWKALIGVAIGLVIGLIIGKRVMEIVRYPIDNALAAHGIEVVETDTGEFAGNGKIVGGTLAVEADASDEAGVTHVDLLIDGEPQATDKNAPYRFDWDTTQHEDGAHTITTRAYDAADNSATSEPVEVTVDNTAPKVAVTAPDAGATVSGSVHVSGTASDNTRVAEMVLFVDDQLIEKKHVKAEEESSWWQFWGNSQDSFRFDWRTPTSDTGVAHQVRVEVRDAAGNVAKKELTVTVDNSSWKDVKAPQVAITKPAPAPSEGETPPSNESTRKVTKPVNVQSLLSQLQKRFPEALGDLKLVDEEWWVNVTVEEKVPAGGGDSSTLQNALQRGAVIEPTAQGPFMAYLKVSLVTGFVLASPWVFYQVWMFVAAGLYHHERHYVHIYLPFSISLFLGGVLFCFVFVLPMVLNFLLTFNRWLNVAPMIRLSDWISFAIMLPLMFGVAFQLPLVMLFLERIGLFTADDYKSKRRPAIMVIAIASMMLTPSDPGSMIAMMVPMLVLYEGGIFLVAYMRRRSPFEEQWEA